MYLKVLFPLCLLVLHHSQLWKLCNGYCYHNKKMALLFHIKFPCKTNRFFQSGSPSFEHPLASLRLQMPFKTIACISRMPPSEGMTQFTSVLSLPCSPMLWNRNEELEICWYTQTSNEWLWHLLPEHLCCICVYTITIRLVRLIVMAVLLIWFWETTISISPLGYA